MAFPTIPVAIGAAGVAAILGYLILSGKKPGAAAASAAVKPPPAKKSAGGGSGAGAPPAKVDWKLAGYRAGLAMGKLDAAGKGGIGVTEVILPSRVAPGTKPMPGTPGGLSASTLSGALAVAAWTTGYADGYPKGFGKSGSATPKYAMDEEASDGTEAYSLDSGGEATSEGTSGTVDYGTPTETTATDTTDATASDTRGETETAGVHTGQGMALYYHPMHRPMGTWGPQRHVLAHAKTGAFARPATTPARGAIAVPRSSTQEYPAIPDTRPRWRDGEPSLQVGPKHGEPSLQVGPKHGEPSLQVGPKHGGPGMKSSSFFDAPSPEYGTLDERYGFVPRPNSPAVQPAAPSGGATSPSTFSSFYGYR